MNARFNHGRLMPLILALFLSQWVAEAQAQKRYSETTRAAQTFRRGDALRLTIYQPWRVGDDGNSGLDLSGDYPIDSRGYVFFPIVGEVRVVGHTRNSLAEALKEKFSPFLQEPIIIAEPLIRIAMMGEFRRPGTYLVDPKSSLWQLVDLAGGPTDDSNLDKMRVERGGKVVRDKLLSGFENAYSLQELGIRSGDQIVVPQKKQFTVRNALEILRFVVSMANLYFLIRKF